MNIIDKKAEKEIKNRTVNITNPSNIGNYFQPVEFYNGKADPVVPWGDDRIYEIDYKFKDEDEEWGYYRTKIAVGLDLPEMMDMASDEWKTFDEQIVYYFEDYDHLNKCLHGKDEGCDIIIGDIYMTRNQIDNHYSHLHTIYQKECNSLDDALLYEKEKYTSDQLIQL